MVFDTATAQKRCAGADRQVGLAARANFGPGDFFAGLARRCRLLRAKGILHNWNDNIAASFSTTAGGQRPERASAGH